MNALELLPFALLGAVLGLDVVSFPQAQLSRPLVSATMAGALAGSPFAGLLVGAALELVAMETLPVGASRYPEWGTASVVGGALFALLPINTPGAMTCSLVAALFTAWVSGWSMVVLRRQNAVWARKRREKLEAGSRNTVVRLQIGGLTADLVRGGLLTFLALLAFRPLLGHSLARWTVDERLSRAISVGVVSAVAAGAVWKLFHGTAGARWYLLAGAAAGLLLLVFR